MFLTDNLNTVEKGGSLMVQGQGLGHGEAAVPPSEHRTECPGQCGSALPSPGALVSSSGEHGQCHPTGWAGGSAGGPRPRGADAQVELVCAVAPGHHGSPWIDGLACVQGPCATSSEGPSLPSSLLLPGSLGPSAIQTCTTSPQTAQGRQ